MELHLKKYYISTFNIIYYIFDQENWYGHIHLKAYESTYNGNGFSYDTSRYYSFYTDGRKCGKPVERLVKECIHRDIIFGR